MHEDVVRIEELEPEILQGIHLTLTRVPDIVEVYKSLNREELPSRVSFGKIGELDQTRFPIGKFEPIPLPSSEERQSFINQIPDITITLRHTLTNLTLDQLQTPYRHEGWTIQQVVHHLADNDMNAYLRFKRALTEDEPLVHSYREDLWAELNDYKDVPIETSILLLESLHSRFLSVLNGMNSDDYHRKLRTQLLGNITLDIALQRFVWHNRHHIAQITSLIRRNGWS
ncbi:putative metal-dependent hydrolase [Cohnella herbarum]|uniref:Putative metal-dependent hydrolase n=2 Tax=Cohnella herbarum TaxID=2728023 RepID=A0A7Z2ZQ59_9BACL|nr:putative metal-dependent hydrolase [Cohnella herbarum]